MKSHRDIERKPIKYDHFEKKDDHYMATSFIDMDDCSIGINVKGNEAVVKAFEGVDIEVIRHEPDSQEELKNFIKREILEGNKRSLDQIGEYVQRANDRFASRILSGEKLNEEDLLGLIREDLAEHDARIRNQNRPRMASVRYILINVMPKDGRQFSGLLSVRSGCIPLPEKTKDCYEISSGASVENVYKNISECEGSVKTYKRILKKGEKCGNKSADIVVGRETQDAGKAAYTFSLNLDIQDKWHVRR